MTLANQGGGDGHRETSWIPLSTKSPDVWDLVREVSWEYTIHSSVRRVVDLSKSLSREIGLGLLVWNKQKKKYAQNSVSFKIVDFYNKIDEVIRKKSVASRMEKIP